MDFEDGSWSYQLIGPDGATAYSDGSLPAHGHGSAHAGRRPHVTARRGNGRLSLMLQRDSADVAAWAGQWSVLVAWRARELDAMVMPDPGELLVPVAGGPVRGPRYARLLQKPEKRSSARSIAAKPRHRLDVRPPSTGRDSSRASTVVVNVYARTRLRLILRPDVKKLIVGSPISVDVSADALRGSVSGLTGFVRMMAPLHDFGALLKQRKLSARLKKEARLEDTGDGVAFDAARLLARLEAREPRLARIRDEELPLLSHHGGPPHVHVHDTGFPGGYSFGFLVLGTYDPGDHRQKSPHAHAGGAPEGAEPFARLLSASVALSSPRRRKAAAKAPKRSKRKR